MAVDFRRAKPESLTLELAPLIDVIFQLLIFFMISSSFLYPALKLTLPKLEQTFEDNAEQNLVLSVDGDGHYFINQNAVTLEALPQALQQALSETEDKSVFFRGDHQIPYEKVLELMRMASASGAAQFNFIYEDKDI
ncbi:MAG TPA: biopolymer transporter ExbD [Opitutales bacterium]|nr:biopolymer transporter ExbD [Opitutales bacterium]